MSHVEPPATAAGEREDTSSSAHTREATCLEMYANSPPTDPTQQAAPAIQDMLYGACRCACNGYAAHAVFDIATVAMRDIRSPVRRRYIATRAIQAALWNPAAARVAALLMGSNLTFGIIRRLARCLMPQRPKLVTAMAGLIAGGFLSADPQSNRRKTLALYAAARGAHWSFLTLERKAQIAGTESAALLTWIASHGNAAAFVVASFEIMFAWFYHPHTLPPAYDFWITRMAELDPRIRAVLRAQYEGIVQYGVRSDFLKEYCLEHGLDPTRADFVTQKPISRLVVHPPDRSSTIHVLRRFVRGFSNAAMLYLPVHGISALLMGHSDKSDGALGMARHLQQLTVRVGFKVVRSSTFLASFIANIYAWIYATRLLLRDDTILGPLLGCATCGLSVLIEARSRRSELALYVLPRAIHSWWIRMVERGWVRPIPGGEVLLFSCALSVIMWHLEHESQSVKPSMQWVFSLLAARECYTATHRSGG